MGSLTGNGQGASDLIAPETNPLFLISNEPYRPLVKEVSPGPLVTTLVESRCRVTAGNAAPAGCLLAPRRVLVFGTQLEGVEGQEFGSTESRNRFPSSFRVSHEPSDLADMYLLGVGICLAVRDYRQGGASADFAFMWDPDPARSDRDELDRLLAIDSVDVEASSAGERLFHQLSARIASRAQTQDRLDRFLAAGLSSAFLSVLSQPALSSLMPGDVELSPDGRFSHSEERSRIAWSHYNTLLKGTFDGLRGLGPRLLEMEERMEKMNDQDDSVLRVDLEMSFDPRRQRTSVNLLGDEVLDKAVFQEKPAKSQALPLVKHLMATPQGSSIVSLFLRGPKSTAEPDQIYGHYFGTQKDFVDEVRRLSEIGADSELQVNQDSLYPLEAMRVGIIDGALRGDLMIDTGRPRNLIAICPGASRLEDPKLAIEDSWGMAGEALGLILILLLSPLTISGTREQYGPTRAELEEAVSAVLTTTGAVTRGQDESPQDEPTAEDLLRDARQHREVLARQRRICSEIAVLSEHRLEQHKGDLELLKLKRLGIFGRMDKDWLVGPMERWVRRARWSTEDLEDLIRSGDAALALVSASASLESSRSQESFSRTLGLVSVLFLAPTIVAGWLGPVITGGRGAGGLGLAMAAGAALSALVILSSQATYPRQAFGQITSRLWLRQGPVVRTFLVVLAIGLVLGLGVMAWDWMSPTFTPTKSA